MQWRSGAVAQGSDSCLRELGFECYDAVSNLGQVLLSTQFQFNGYLAIDSGGYLSLRTLIAAWLDTSEKSKWCSTERVCQGEECNAF